MAVTENLFTGNGSTTTYSFTFPYLKTTDIKATVGGSATTAFTLPTATTLQFNTAPANAAQIRIYRDTADDDLSATFYAGSSIKSQDLNDNFTQTLYLSQEAKHDADTAWQTGTETVDSTETWESNNNRVATTGAIDGRVDAKIDTAIENDVLAGTDLAKTQSGGQVTINHNVSGASSVNNSNGTVIQDVTLNANGHVTALGSYDLDGRYYTETELNAGQLDNRYYTETELNAGQLDNRYYTETELLGGALDGRYFTETEADARYFNISTGDTIKDGQTFPDNDTTIATTAAINDRIIDLVDDVGGFVPIANETSFPNANPDVNNGTGTLVSIKALASNLTSNGSGEATVSNGTVGNSTVTITGLANSTTYAAGFGMLVETSSTLHTYTFHRLVPKATEVSTVAGSISNVNTTASNISNVNSVAGNASNINSAVSNSANINTVAGAITNVNTVATNVADVNNFADLYQIATSAPSTDGGGNSLAAGDMWFDSSSNKTLKVHNGTAFQSVSPSQTVLNDISIVSGQITFIEDLGSIADALTTGTGNNINTVAASIANVNTDASNIASINSVAGSISNVNSTAGSIANVNTVAGSIADVNRYANEYQIASSAPNGPSEGDLWYDSTNNVLKYHNGSGFIGISSGLTAIVQDTSPALGGHLDCNDKNLTEVGTVSGNNLQIDFGTLS
ncbi:MAG: hypothetical protein CBD88_01825 [Flavobacteriales bacterium TMED228]|nr:MAG: hypothetical protein CBD88_01825 [Flavobacteriales bacterium TMED228]